MTDKRRNLGTVDPEEYSLFMLPYGRMGELPPDPGYTQDANELIKRRRSRARMNEPDDSGDIEEGLSYRSRMAGQNQDPGAEDH